MTSLSPAERSRSRVVRGEHVPVDESVRYDAGDDELSVLVSDGRVFGFSLMAGAVNFSGV
jgi:hypothetical protein